MNAQVSARVSQMPEKAAVEVKTRAAAGSRLMFIDNLRVFLIILVILHHLSITYGSGLGSWYYHEASSPLTQIVFSLFIILNQGYFMGLFFLVSGFFAAASLEKKGLGRFIKDRLVRLGIPLVVFTVLINTLPLYVSATSEGYQVGSFWQFFANYVKGLDYSTGPLWFVEALLLFSIVYAAGKAIWNKIRESLPASAAPRPLTNTQVLLFVVTLALALFVTRIFVPTGVTWHNWELGFFPQYILMFAAGILARRYTWLPDLSPKVAKTWTIVAVASILILAPVMMASGGTGNLDAFNGGISLPAVISSTWTAIYGTAMSILMLNLFRKRLDSQGRLGKLLSQNAFTVYIVHAPVIVWLAYLTRGIMIDPFIKFFVMAAPAVILCFAISQLIRQIPGTQKVL